MRSFLLFSILLLFFLTTFAQKKTGGTIKDRAAVLFPQSFVGRWKGTLEWFPAGAREPKKVPMELIIQPLQDSAGQYSWNLIYGSVTADNRPYVLKPVDTALGHWMIDERDGILLDEYWINNRLYGAFTVQGSTIINSYRLENKQLVIEYITYPVKPLATTGKGSEEVPFVDSYRIKSCQYARLTKQK